MRDALPGELTYVVGPIVLVPPKQQMAKKKTEIAPKAMQIREQQLNGAGVRFHSAKLKEQ